MAEEVIDRLSVELTANVDGLKKGVRQAKEALESLDGVNGGSGIEAGAKKAEAAVKNLGSTAGITGLDLSVLSEAVSRIGDGVSLMTASVNSSASSIDKLVSKLGKLNEEREKSKNTFNGTEYTGFNIVASEAEFAAVGVKDFEAATSTLGELTYEIREGIFDLSHSFSDLSETGYKAADSSESVEMSAEEAAEAIEDLGVSIEGMDNSLVGGVYSMKNLDEATEKTTASLSNFSKAAAVLGIGKLFKEAISEAGELEQNIGGAQSVFKSYSASIEKTAKTAYESLGLSESKYLATATKMGALFQGTGSSAAQSAEMTANAMKRAADVASIMGISIDDAMYSISGMAKGNFTMMDNLGVAMNDTTLQIYAQEKGLGKLETTQQKVNAAYQMFMDKTEYAAQNYEKENATYSGSLTTLKAEFENFMAEAGTAAMPIVTEGIKLLSGALNDFSPIITTVASGIGAVGDIISELPEPLVKTAAYVITTTIAWKKLNAVLGATASKFMLIAMIGLAIFGKLSEAAEASANASGGVYDDMESGIESAEKAQDSLTDSMNETSKAMSKLAGFDEITKLTSSTTTTFSTDTTGADFDTTAVEDYADAVAAATESFGVLDSGASIVLNNIGTYWSEVWGLMTSGDWEGVFAKLGTGIDSFLTDLFGDSWINIRDYWGKILGKVQSGDVFGAISQVLNDVDTILESIFGDVWTNFSDYWKKIGEKIASGDVLGAVEDLGRSLVDAFNDIFRDAGKQITDFFKGYGSYLYEMTHAGEINNIELSGKYSVADLNSLVVDSLKQGMTADEAVEVALESYLTSSEAVYWYENVLESGNQLTTAKAQKWRNNLINSGQLEGEKTEVPTISKMMSKAWAYGTNTAIDAAEKGTSVQSVVNFAVNAANQLTGGNLQADTLSVEDYLALQGTGNTPIEIHTEVDLDGEKVGESVTQYQNDQTYRSNGLEAY